MQHSFWNDMEFLWIFMHYFGEYPLQNDGHSWLRRMHDSFISDKRNTSFRERACLKNTTNKEDWTFPLSLAKYHVFFSKMQDFPQKKYSLPLQGIYVSVVLVCSMNLTHWIPVLDVILNTTMKPPLLAKKLLSCFCKSPLRKLNVFFNTQYPYKLWRHPLKDAAFLLKKGTFFQMIGNNPAPYVACFF